MSDLMDKIVERAKADRQRIVLPEGTEERTLQAADRVLAEGIADLILLGNKEEIMNVAKKFNLKNIDKATIIDPSTSEKKEEYEGRHRRPLPQRQCISRIKNARCQ